MKKQFGEFFNFEIDYRILTFVICAIIFFLSIYLRSMIDIGSDTAFYLDLGQRISEGKKYYYDFFESNFPLSFYFYAFEYRLAKIFHISPIIMSEILNKKELQKAIVESK